MKQLYLHQDTGLRVYETETKENLYRNSLEQAATDAEINFSWPEANILRIFPLADGRLAVVREIANVPSQEAASSDIQNFYQAIVAKTELLIQKEAERKASEVIDEAPSDEA